MEDTAAVLVSLMVVGCGGYAMLSLYQARRVREHLEARLRERQCWCSFLGLERPDRNGFNRPLGFQVGRQFAELKARAERAERKCKRLNVPVPCTICSVESLSGGGSSVPEPLPPVVPKTEDI